MTLRLRQLQVVHRHGDRTPLRNVFRGGSARAEEAEHARWSETLPLPEQLAALRAPYPVQKATGVHDPLQTRPFGFLTTTGIEQMHARGDKLRALCEREAFPLNALSDASVQVFSNSYTRTQLSVQSLLRGLLRNERHLAPRVHVLAPDQDIINTYALFPEIAQLKTELEQTHEALAAREHIMAPRKQELVRTLPLFENVPFTWMAAADYFVCRAAHNVALVPGTEAHRAAAIDHLSFRFHCFYSNQRILQLVAGRLMHHVLAEMQHAAAQTESSKPLVVYSGHDISILSVLHATCATRALDDDTWWPDYASAVALELLEDEHSGDWFVRVRLDDDVLALCTGRSISAKADEQTLVPLDAFKALVADKLGGFEL